MMNLAQTYCLIIRYRVPLKVSSIKNSEVSLCHYLQCLGISNQVVA